MGGQTRTHHAGPHTFETEREADDWLTTQRADLVRDVRRSPDLGSDTLASYMCRWIDQRTDLAVSTRVGYAHTLARWIDRELLLPAPRGARPVRIHFGTQPLNALTVGAVREWYAAAQRRERAEREARGVLWRACRGKAAHVRAWARSAGWTVPDTGRLSPAVLEAPNRRRARDVGANYAEAAFDQWAGLEHAATRLLLRTALVSKDSDTPPIYWGGWEVLAHALSADMPHRDDTSADAERLHRNANRRVLAALANLERVGAISRHRRGRLALNAEYRLNLQPMA